MNDITVIERDILRQVYSRFESFEQYFIFDDDEDSNYYSPEDLVISLSPVDYFALKEALNGR